MLDPGQVGRLVVGLWLVIAAAGKWRNFRWFVDVVDSYRLIPRKAVSVASLGIMVAETTCGTMLLLGIGRPFVNLAAGGLFVLFAGAIALQVMQGRTSLECGCGSSGQVSWLLVVRNAGLLCLVAVSLLEQRTALSLLFLVVGLVGTYLANLTRVWDLMLLQLASAKSGR